MLSNQQPSDDPVLLDHNLAAVTDSLRALIGRDWPDTEDADSCHLLFLDIRDWFAAIDRIAASLPEQLSSAASAVHAAEHLYAAVQDLVESGQAALETPDDATPAEAPTADVTQPAPPAPEPQFTQQKDDAQQPGTSRDAYLAAMRSSLQQLRNEDADTSEPQPSPSDSPQLDADAASTPQAEPSPVDAQPTDAPPLHTTGTTTHDELHAAALPTAQAPAASPFRRTDVA
ncbi:MAG: hypothetical protein AAF747_08510 [Planctomycetota bacterium]